MMRERAILQTILLSATFLAGGAVAGGDGSTERDRAASAVASFAGDLKRALTSAMSSSGPVGAIEVCRTQAPIIAEQVSRASGLRVSRTGTRVRNPANAPASWQAAVLNEWQRWRDEGKDLEGIEYFEHLPDGGFRYMKPIVVAPLCLGCHGSSLTPEITAALESSYPRDRATGSAAGDLRGAFVVES